MTFDEAEARFRELQARVQRGEAISRVEYEDQVSQLAVQDDRGVLWEINPRTGKWMYFDGAEWVGGTPPGRDNSTVMPAPRAPIPPATPPPGVRTSAPAAPPSSASTPPLGRFGSFSGARQVAPSSTARTTGPNGPAPNGQTPPGSRPSTPASPETVPPYVRVSQSQPTMPPPEPPSGPAPAPGGGQVPARVLRAGPLGGQNREWVPLAIGAVVLLLCAILLFFGGRVVLVALGPTTTPTRATIVALATNTPVPTVVRLPTQSLPTSTPQPVLAKVIENTVNVRAEPSTKAKVISSLKKNNQIALVARNDPADWYQINITGGTQGWVFAATLQIVSGDPKALPVAGAAAAPTKPPAQAPAVAKVTATLTPIGAH